MVTNDGYILYSHVSLISFMKGILHTGTGILEIEAKINKGNF